MQIKQVLFKKYISLLILVLAIYFVSCKQNSDNSGISFGLNITVVTPTGEKIENATLELYVSSEDRNLGKNIVISKKTDINGFVNIIESELNKNRQQSENIKNIYYLNIFRQDLRKQVEVEFADFSEHKKVKKTVQLENANAETIVVKVAVVYEDPILQPQNKRFHELFITPGYSFKWNNPIELSRN